MASSMKSQAYVKMLLHGAKYPHYAVNGVLLGPKSNSGDKLQITDCIPLFHLNLNLVPMLEIALCQIEAYCNEQELAICGYYHMHSHRHDDQKNILIQKTMEKLSENCGRVVLLMVDNNQLALESKSDAPFTVYESRDGRLVDGPQISVEEGASEAAHRLMHAEEYHKLVDFDNHLDNLSQDWRNTEIYS